MNTIHILYLNEDPSHERLVLSVLSEADVKFNIFTETKSEAALKKVEESNTTIDCILCDVTLTDSDGLSVLKTVRESQPQLPFILFTESESEQVASDAISAGVTNYLQKCTQTDQYQLLTNRIKGFVQQYWAQRNRVQLYYALESATEGIGVLNEDNEYLYLNEAYAELYGYARDELLGEHWERLYPKNEAKRFHNEILPKLEREGSWTGRSKGKNKTGGLFTESLSLTQLDTGGHVCVVRDISEQEIQKRRFETLTNNIRGLFYYRENDPSWPMEVVEGDIEESFGYSATELESQAVSWGDLIHPEDEDLVWDTIQNAVAGDGVFDLSYRILDKEGRIKFVIERGHVVYNPDGTIDGIEGLILDVTEQQEQRHELEWKTRAMDEAPIGIVISDPSEKENPLIYVNSHFSELTSYAEDEILGVNCRFLQGPLTSTEPVQQMREAIAAEEPVEVELLNYRKDGTPFWNQVHISPIYDEEDQLTHFVGFQNNVTTRVEQQKRIEILHRIILHNIRNKLNTILGYEELLIDKYSIGEADVQRFKEPAEQLLASSEKANQIESVLKGASFEPTDIATHSMIEYAIDNIGVETETVSFDMDGLSNQTIRTPEPITVAFSELLENAVKHSGAGDTTVTIQSESNVTDIPNDDINRDTFTVHICDRNAPISEFEQTRLLGHEESPTNHGTGLGLWLVNWLVTMSGGIVSYTPRTEGNRISVTLVQAPSTSVDGSKKV